MNEPKRERLSVEEIEAIYPNHWILIDDPETDEHNKVLSGKVVCASEERNVIYRDPANRLSKSLAVHCTRKPPKDLRFMPWLIRLVSKTPSSQ